MGLEAILGLFWGGLDPAGGLINGVGALSQGKYLRSNPKGYVLPHNKRLHRNSNKPTVSIILN